MPPEILFSPKDLIEPGASVVFVGNGESARGKKLGAVIDSFDHVVRFNSYAVKGFEEDLGSRTTIWATYGRNSKPQDPEQRPPILLQAHGQARTEHEFVQKLLPVPPSFFSRFRDLLKNLGWVHSRDNSGVIPSTGLVAVAYTLLECDVPQVAVVGFDHFDRQVSMGRHHYWDPKSYKAPKEHDGEAEKYLFRMFAEQGRLSYLAGVAPENYIHPKARLGRGTKVWHFAIVHDNVVLGDDCSVGSRVEVSKGVRVGNRTRISSGVFLAPNMDIGDDVFIGPNTTFTDDRFPVSGNSSYQSEPAVIESGASIGAGCVILPGVRIGAGSLVGAGSVVAHDVPPGVVLRGEPACVVRIRTKDDEKGSVGE